MNLEFDQATHTYKLDGVIVPSVTQILNELVPIQYKAGDWYLQRGKAVHACAAFIAKGIDFDFNEQIAGQVAAIRKFFDEIKPEVIEIEKPVFSMTYRFAGTFDLKVKINFAKILIEYKSSFSIYRTALQLAAYSLCNSDSTIMLKPVLLGMGIEIREDGTYKMMDKPINLKKYQREFLALRATYAVRERLGLNKKEED